MSDHESIPGYCFQFCGQFCISQTLSYEFTLSSIFSVATILVSAYHIYMHLSHFNNPFFQSKIIVILIMAPFYCITSMGSFVFPHLQAYFTLSRDTYEALLLFVFFYLMFSYLAYDRDKDVMEDKKVYVIMIQHQKQVAHFWPFNYCQKPYQLTHWKKAKYFTYRCKKYVLQFLVVKVFTTLLMYIIYPNEQEAMESDHYNPKDHSTYLFVSSCVSWIVGISASYSLYYLVLFYHALKEPLAPYSALLKFLTIKITIFFTFWQKVMLSIFSQNILACFDHSAPNYHGTTIITSLQNTLICFEMLIMAIAGGLAYNYENYVTANSNTQGTFKYVLEDTIRAFKSDFRLIKPKKFGFSAKIQQETELKDIKNMARPSNVCQIKVQQPLQQVMINDYL